MAMGEHMPTDMRPLHTLFQWLSPSYPIGAFSYSHGLEWAITQGDISCADTLHDWLADILCFGTGRNDAILLVAAYHGVEGVEELALAYTPSAERLLETTAQGAAFAQTTSAIWGDDGAAQAYPVAFGKAAKAHRVGLEPAVGLYLHAFMANLVSVAVRFVPLGQTEGQRVLAKLSTAIDETAQQALCATLDDLGGHAFRSDMTAMQHETLTTRIFRT